MIDVINIILYVAIWISGTVFGSFFTLAVHRIPKHQDITHERSYCPNCNHKLQFLDLIPVLSYIFLGGKCRYCKTKIRPRYLILEICSGLTFLLLAISQNITCDSTIKEWILFVLSALFIVSLFITAGIDKEHHKVINGVMLYGTIIGVFKVIYLFIFDLPFLSNSICFGVCVILWFVFNIISSSIVEKDANSSSHSRRIDYIQGLLLYLATIGLFFGYKIFLIGLAATIILCILYNLALKIFKKENKIPAAFIISIVYTVLLFLNI
ncbi:MAG: prepilin peptidase [Clostridia bacterium]|nr:prepilin peptidase [Clostridia bacterium]